MAETKSITAKEFNPYQNKPALKDKTEVSKSDDRKTEVFESAQKEIENYDVNKEQIKNLLLKLAANHKLSVSIENGKISLTEEDSELSEDQARDIANVILEDKEDIADVFKELTLKDAQYLQEKSNSIFKKAKMDAPTFFHYENYLENNVFSLLKFWNDYTNSMFNSALYNSPMVTERSSVLMPFESMFNMDKTIQRMQKVAEEMKENPDSRGYYLQQSSFSEKREGGKIVENARSQVTNNNGEVKAEAEVFFPAEMIENGSKEDIFNKLPEVIREKLTIDDLKNPYAQEGKDAVFKALLETKGDDMRINTKFDLAPKSIEYWDPEPSLDLAQKAICSSDDSSTMGNRSDDYTE